MITFNELGKYGRLGNQMFQVASVIGLATRFGYEYGFPLWVNHDHKNRFGSQENINIYEYFQNPLPLAGETDCDRFVHWGWHDLYDLQDRTNITGHLQSERYFEHCQELIRYHFELKDKSNGVPEDAICIHVRRGDYDDNYHPTLKADYYMAALREMPIGPVYVFSDSPDEAEQMLGDDFIYVRGNHYMKDLQMMAQCRHFILSNSTLCWWGWWLSGKKGKVVAPSRWFGRIAGISPQDIYTKEMLVI